MDNPVLTTPTVQVGPYTLTRRLGVGGMGEVWAGRRTHGAGAYKTVAVKILPPGRAHDDDSRRMFDDEARLSMLLCNSNIVQVFDVGEDAGVCYMAMEWVDGLNLDELSAVVRERGEVLPLSVVGYVIGEILKALAYAHDFEHEGEPRTIVHRDVSAHNVMISVAGEVKLMDFGIARVASEETSGLHVKGKLRYMPPEQLRGDTRAPTIDLFAVGAILHELLDGRRFRAGVVDEARLYGMVLDGEVPPLTCPAERVPPQLDALRSGLLAAKVADRISSAREAHRVLSTWPGYRDAKFELQDLVRGCTKSSGPPTAIITSPDHVRTNQLTAQMAALRQAASTEENMQRSVTVREPAVSVAPGEALRASIPKWMLMGLAIVLPMVALALGVVALSMFAARVEPSGEVEAAAIPASSGQDEIVAVTPAEVAPPVDQAPAPEPPDQREPAPAVEPDTVEPAATTPAEPDQQRPQVRAKPRVSVKLAAPDVFWLEIEIAGKRHVFERMRGRLEVKVRLRPGNHRVRYRDDAARAWRSGGTVTIPETTDTLVMTFQQSGKFVVE